MNFLSTVIIGVLVNLACDQIKKYNFKEKICKCLLTTEKYVVKKVTRAKAILYRVLIKLYSIVKSHFQKIYNQIIKRIKSCCIGLYIKFSSVYIFIREMHISIADILYIIRYAFYLSFLCNCNNILNFSNVLTIYLLCNMGLHSQISVKNETKRLNIDANIHLQMDITASEYNGSETPTLKLTENNIEVIKNVIRMEILKLRKNDTIENNIGKSVIIKNNKSDINKNHNGTQEKEIDEIHNISSNINLINNSTNVNNYNIDNRSINDISSDANDSNIDDINNHIEQSYIERNINNNAVDIDATTEINLHSNTNFNNNDSEIIVINDFHAQNLFDNVDHENTIINTIDTHTNIFLSENVVRNITNKNNNIIDEELLTEKREFEKIFQLNNNNILQNHIFTEPIDGKPENTVSDDQQFPPETKKKGLSRYRKQKSYTKNIYEF
ncbi:hypothetical protein TCON_1115 [Astathelohania contejeani]|uniref:Uncharacterized protein n=1 Tax=Astathelohania contejeani TaxID=164912 RepID=A0ABQ7HZV2_9MICR|nr:hypothetical protein TCON_1115 [Thelohania contejeani]